MIKSGKKRKPKSKGEYSWRDCNCSYHNHKKKALIKANTSKYEAIA